MAQTPDTPVLVRVHSGAGAAFQRGGYQRGGTSQGLLRPHLWPGDSHPVGLEIPPALGGLLETTWFNFLIL